MRRMVRPSLAPISKTTLPLFQFLISFKTASPCLDGRVSFSCSRPRLFQRCICPRAVSRQVAKQWSVRKQLDVMRTVYCQSISRCFNTWIRCTGRTHFVPYTSTRTLKSTRDLKVERFISTLSAVYQRFTVGRKENEASLTFAASRSPPRHLPNNQPTPKVQSCGRTT